MLAMEATVLIATCAAQAALLIGPPNWSLPPWLLAAVPATVALVTRPARWQLAPAYLTMAGSLVLILTSNPAAEAAGAAWALMAGTMLLLAAVLCAGVPLPDLPKPGGPFVVGTTAFPLARPCPGGADDARRLWVKVWYPAQASRGAPEPLWAEFYQGRRFSPWIRALTAYLKYVPTHAYGDAALMEAPVPWPVIVYQHSLISIAAENTVLLEALASHGYVVLSVRHLDQQAEYQAVQTQVPKSERAADKPLQHALRGALPRSERARLSAQLYRQSTGMATIVQRRTADTRFVLDSIDALANAVPGCAGLNASQVFAMGFSLGGAVASELCKTDGRCRAAVNMDGGLYGEHGLAPAPVAYLMLYSEPNQGSNDRCREVSGPAFEEQMLPGSRHLDFHDAAFVLPICRWLGVLGKRPARLVHELKLQHIRSFLAHIREPSPP